MLPQPRKVTNLNLIKDRPFQDRRGVTSPHDVADLHRRRSRRRLYGSDGPGLRSHIHVVGSRSLVR